MTGRWPIHFLLVFLAMASYINCWTQIGGTHTFSFLALPNSARVTALGSSAISTKDGDISLALQSPSLLNDQMDLSFSINHNFHLADISYGNVSFGKHIESLKLSTIVSVSYLNYGTFKRTDEFFNVLGEFGGNDVSFLIGAARKWNERITTGINIKWVTSRLDQFSSSGIGLDFGISYEHPTRNTLYTLSARNIGLQFSPFDESRESFPLDIQMGTSRRLKYLPLRLSFILHNLNNWDLYTERTLDDQNIFISQEENSPSSFSRGVDNFFRHVIVSGEFLIGNNEVFRLRFGYNHRIKQELSVSPFRSLSGFSFGFGFRIKKFSFDYGFGAIHLAGGMNHLSLRTNLMEWK